MAVLSSRGKTFLQSRFIVISLSLVIMLAGFALLSQQAAPIPGIDVLLDEAFAQLEPHLSARLSALANPPAEPLSFDNLPGRLESLALSWSTEGYPSAIVASPLVAALLGERLQAPLLVVGDHATGTADQTLHVYYEKAAAYKAMGATAGSFVERNSRSAANGCVCIFAIQELFPADARAIEAFSFAFGESSWGGTPVILNIPDSGGGIDRSGLAESSILKAIETAEGAGSSVVLVLSIFDAAVAARIAEARPEIPLFLDRSAWGTGLPSPKAKVQGWIDARESALAFAAESAARRAARKPASLFSGTSLKDIPVPLRFSRRILPWFSGKTARLSSDR